MAFWSKKKPQQCSFQKQTIPGDVGTVSLPSFFTVEIDNGDTLVAYRDDLSTLRISSISFTKKGESNEETAREYVRQSAEEKHQPYSEKGETGITSFEERTEQDGHALVISYWFVGAKNTLVIVSVTVLTTEMATPAVREIFDLMPAIIESVTVTVSHKSIVYDDQEVPTIERVFEKNEQPEQKITVFGPSENAWLEENQNLAVSLGVKYGSGGDLTPEELDVVFSRWMLEDDDKEPANSVANALGAAFGDHLVENHGFRWVVISDEYGTDYAVRHQIGSTTSFPVSSVAKRIEENQPECFQTLRTAILGFLARYETENSG